MSDQSTFSLSLALVEELASVVVITDEDALSDMSDDELLDLRADFYGFIEAAKAILSGK